MVIGAAIGVLLGLPSGYYGGWLDDVVMRVMDVMLAFPGILFAMAIVAILGSGLTNVMIAVGISSIPGFVRLVRGSVLSAAEHVYVEAARGPRLPRRPASWGSTSCPTVAPLFTYATLRVSVAIISVASLNFLGLGAQPPTPEWGVMLADGRDYMRDYWWLATFPGLAIMITTLSINLFSNGLRDVLDPRLQPALRSEGHGSVVRCALVQVGSDLPMDGRSTRSRAALNDKCARLIEDGSRAPACRSSRCPSSSTRPTSRGHGPALVRRR